MILTLGSKNMDAKTFLEVCIQSSGLQMEVL